MKSKDDFSILIVDDEIQLCDTLATVFELEDYTVYKANSGNEALNIISDKKVSIDFVISDIRMPDGRGDELLIKIRNTFPETPLVLLMTGQSEFSNEDAIKAGAIGVYAKPIDFELILSLVEKARTNI
jgi:DNA-binding NtrC family response regulator